MAIRRVTGAVSPSELIFADANALGATYDGSGTTIERGETFTLPAAGTTAVSNGALRLEALKGDCTITNNGNSTLTNASGVDGTIVMRSGASDFPAFVRNSSMGSMSTPAREDFTGDVSGTINSNAVFPAGHILQVQSATKTGTVSIAASTVDSPQDITGMSVSITPSATTSKFFVSFTANIGGASGDNILLRVLRGSTAIGVGVDNNGTVCSTETDRFSGSTQYSVDCVTFSVLDDPTLSDLSAITYKLQWIRSYSGAGVAYLNRSQNRAAEADRADTASTITVMEIAG